MKVYEFDQSGLGEFLESDTRQDRTAEDRIAEIHRALFKSIVVEIIMGGIMIVITFATRDNLFLMPLWYSFIWAYVWCVTSMRTVFGITGLWRIGVVKADRIRIAKSFWKHLLVHLGVLIWFLIWVGWCSEDMRFGVNYMMCGFVLALIGYGLTYMSCSVKRLRWWEFSNYQEEYWKY